jgi:hypothetical protein
VGANGKRISNGGNNLQDEWVKPTWLNMGLPSMLEDGSLRIDPVLISSHEKAKSVSCPIGEFLGFNLPIWQEIRGFVTMRINRAWRAFFIALKRGMVIIYSVGK